MLVIFAYYAGIMLNAFGFLSCSKLCWHNRLKPNVHVARSISLYTCSTACKIDTLICNTSVLVLYTYNAIGDLRIMLKIMLV